MLNNAGKKIAVWSFIVLYAGIILSVVAGLMMIIRGAQWNTAHIAYYYAGSVYRTGTGGGGLMIVGGLLVMVLGSLASWLTALLLRVFSDLTEDTKAIREQLEWAPVEIVEETIEEPAPVKKPAKPKAEAPAKPDAREKPEA